MSPRVAHIARWPHHRVGRRPGELIVLRRPVRGFDDGYFSDQRRSTVSQRHAVVCKPGSERRSAALRTSLAKRASKSKSCILPGFIVESVRGLGVCDCVPGSSNCARELLEPAAASPAIKMTDEKQFRNPATFLPLTNLQDNSDPASTTCPPPEPESQAIRSWPLLGRTPRPSPRLRLTANPAQNARERLFLPR